MCIYVGVVGGMAGCGIILEKWKCIPKSNPNPKCEGAYKLY